MNKRAAIRNSLLCCVTLAVKQESAFSDSPRPRLRRDWQMRSQVAKFATLSRLRFDALVDYEISTARLAFATES